MTHDELLADIDRKILLSEYTIYPVFMQALRAVVELHKPETGWVDGVEVENHHCSCDTYNEYDMGYPCETIEAIEKELK